MSKVTQSVKVQETISPDPGWTSLNLVEITGGWKQVLRIHLSIRA